MRARVIGFLRRNLREDELGRAGIALGLASLTVLAAVVAGLQGQASIEAQKGNREANRIGLEAAGRDASTVVQIGTAYGTYRRWFEQVERANWARDQLTRDPNSPNKTMLQTLEQADSAIAEWTKSQTDLMNPPFNSDFSAFHAQRSTGPAVLAAEQRAVEADVASAWDGKASEYVTILTVVAVGLFLLGLSSTVRSRARPVLASAGVLFGAVSLVWTVSVGTTPIHRVPQAAIDQLVASRITLDRAPNAQGESELAATAREAYETAIRQADQAVAADPAYLAAYLNRAEARIFYADAIVFSSGPSDQSAAILKTGAADYRTYLDGHPDDYAAWWNLGWANYLLGDQHASIDATNQALIRSPAQFPLYLNRALAFLAGGDPVQAQADVDEAVRRAGVDTSDSAYWYLGQSDFDIGRLVNLYPAQAEFLRAVQLRLREAQVAVRVLGIAAPAADAPSLASVAVVPVELKRYAGGQLQEGAPLTAGAHFASTDAVGVRVVATGLAGLKGRTLSARVWVGGLPSPEYNADIAVDKDAVTIDLISPYGLAGFNLDAGQYSLDLYVDGVRRFQLDWTVDPRPDHPLYSTTATPFVETVKTDIGFVCDAPVAADDRSTVSCSVKDSDGNAFFMDVTFDTQDRITYVVLTTLLDPASTARPGAVAHPFFEYVVRKLYPSDLAERAVAWIEKQDTTVDDIDIGGTTLRVYGNDDRTRNLDIWSPWPQ